MATAPGFVRTPTRVTAERGRGDFGRAYCGPAHGHRWALHARVPPQSVELGDDRTRVRYQLVHHPRTRKPARDHLGNYLYMPLRVWSGGPTSQVPFC